MDGCSKAEAPRVRRFLMLVLAVVATAVVGCSAASTDAERKTVPVPTDAGTDADAAASPEPAPNGGRDDLGASCYAACQNAGFTCQEKSASTTIVTTADVTPDAKGCSGTLTTGSAMGPAVALAIDCTNVQICRGAAPGEPATICTSGTFSAFSFAYEPTAGAPQNVCTRN
jgi:hypothetical protein